MLRSITTTSATGLLVVAVASMSVAAGGSASAHDLLSDLRTEEVQAGVHRVVGDEFRDLPTEAGWRVSAGLDDSVWLLSQDRALRLGREGSIDWPADKGEADLTWWRPTAYGALIGVASNADDEWFVASFEGPDSEPRFTPYDDGLEPYALMPDGRAWAHRVEDDMLTYSLSRLDDDGWVEVVADLDVAGPQVTAAGELWLGSDFLPFETPELRRFADGEWAHFAAPERTPSHGWTVGPDGTAWTWALYPIGYPDPAFLARLKDGVWTSWERDDLPPFDEMQYWLDTSVAPDGALWVGAPVWVSSMNNKVRRCRGFTRFDGRTTTYLEDHCVRSLSISPDGSVWVRANEAGRKGGRSQRAPFHTYVIPPAAVTDVSAADDEAVGQRMAQPELSASVIVPEGWTIESIFGESNAVAPDGVSLCALNGTRFDEPVEVTDALLERVAEMYVGLPDDGPLPVIDTADVGLPAGRSIRLITDAGLRTADAREGESRFSTMYLLMDPERMVVFGCWSEERAEDDWLAIAETIELMPLDGPSPSEE